MTHTHDQQEHAPGDDSLPAWLERILVCPVCRAKVAREGDAYVCLSCARRYPVRYGIPDFRLAPDPYISIEKELEKIDALFSGGEKNFRELLTAYYVLSPENPPSLNRHYVDAMAAAVQRGRGILDRLSQSVSDAKNEAFLDLGCGTGGMLASAESFFGRAVGVDVALRWMLIGRQRLRELGVSPAMICANAESLPFADGAFAAVGADAVLEHVSDPVKTRDETLRVLAPHGAFFFTTNNRYSVLPEPHVRILGFGLLPRQMMERAAWTFRRTPYKARLLSLRELRNLFRGITKLSLPDYREGELGQHNERLRELWARLTKFRLVRGVLWPVSPQYFVSGRKGAGSSR